MRTRPAVLILASLAVTAGLGSCGDSGTGDAMDGTGDTAARVRLTAAQERQVDHATQRYADFVRGETAALLAGTERFVAAVKATGPSTVISSVS